MRPEGSRCSGARRGPVTAAGTPLSQLLGWVGSLGIGTLAGPVTGQAWASSAAPARGRGGVMQARKAGLGTGPVIGSLAKAPTVIRMA